ncbi:enoyl-CoA hydratase/isomerase family protein [Ramlibacter rhizophilus]|nr:enoyl-CoA hydratase/isomerase family protein [Ramlibacter rhizophilus]
MNPSTDVIVEERGRTGLITLNRPRALNALSLDMVRTLTATLLDWAQAERIEAVAIRGMGKDGPFSAFCAGGDIRFFHQAAVSGDARIEDFFTEEYTLNHLVHRFPKPYVVFMDGIVMGGGMGIAGHGSAQALRLATSSTRMAMPETNIGLFPDVGGGWFLARCPGALGEYLALTGEVIGAEDARHAGLADGVLAVDALPAAWERLAEGGAAAVAALRGEASQAAATGASLAASRASIDRCFSLPDVPAIVGALEAAEDDWARKTAATLRKRSPLMLHVVLEQLRRARGMSLAEDLRMERGMVRRCFERGDGGHSETVEGIRALAIDKDHAPRWQPDRIEAVDAALVARFFDSPWPAHAHPLRGLD